MIQPFIYRKPSHPSQPSRSGVGPACEGFCDGFGSDKKPSQFFEAICEGVTVVKVLRGIKGEKGFYLMTVIVEKNAEDNGHGTVGTLGTDYFTRDKNNGNKPTYPCSICGSNNWWRNNGKWQCGRCHPEPQGELLFHLDKSTGG